MTGLASPLDATAEALHIARMIPAAPAFSAAGDDAAARVRRRREVDAHQAELTGRRARLALAFGEARGWRVSLSDFDEPTLAAGKTNAGSRRRQHGWEWGAAFLDHLTFYRGPDRRAVAVVAQPYGDAPWTEDEARLWAAELGLLATFPSDFPSWHYPGRTRLVLIEPVISRPASPPPAARARGQG